MSNTPSLGELLRTKIQHDQDEEARLAQAKVDDENAEKHRIQLLLTRFFDDAKAQFTRNIVTGRPVKPIEVGKNHSHMEVGSLLGRYSGPDFTDAKHPYYSYWKDFTDWAESNGLQATWCYAHDMMSESWHNLSVQPATT